MAASSVYCFRTVTTTVGQRNWEIYWTTPDACNGCSCVEGSMQKLTFLCLVSLRATRHSIGRFYDEMFSNPAFADLKSVVFSISCCFFSRFQVSYDAMTQP